MKIAAEKLAVEAQKTGFKPYVLEKVAHLVRLLSALQHHPFLKGKLALKGGTALNLFVFDVPRLSVDIDLNYVGAEDRGGMLAERPKIDQAVKAVFEREGFKVRRMPEEHAGGKWLLRYESATGQSGNLEVDINFMFRIPLWPLITCDSRHIGVWQAEEILMLDRQELAVGKLVALLARKQAKDLFDSHQIFQMTDLDFDRIRIGFVVYGAMNRKDWRTVSVDDVAFDARDVVGQMLPTLRVHASNAREKLMEFAENLVQECKERLSAVLPFTDAESAFLDQLLERGVIDATLLTDDASLQQRIKNQPLLEWKALNVRRYKGLI